MKHCVFGAGYFPKNQKAIDAAKQAVAHLKAHWELNAEVHGIYEGSKFIINSNDGNNISIYVEDDDIHRLIYSAMCFAKEYTAYEINNK